MQNMVYGVTHFTEVQYSTDLQWRWQQLAQHGIRHPGCPHRVVRYAVTQHG